MVPLPLAPNDVELWADQGGSLSLWRSGTNETDDYRLRFDDQIAVDLKPVERLLLESAVAADVPASTRDHFLSDQVLPRLLAHQGQLVLHAGAVMVNGSAIAIIGASGSGKSTLVASLDQGGHGLLGDDALIVSDTNGEARIRSIYRSLRLLPDSIDRLFPATATFDVAHYTPKQRISLSRSGDDETKATAPLRAMFVIGSVTAGEDIEVRRMSVAQACMAVIANSFTLDPTDLPRARKRMEHASHLANQVATFAIDYPHDYARLPDVRRSILAHIDGLPAVGPG